MADAANRRAIGVTLGAALVLAVAYLLLPLAGTDLAAQVARANFAGEQGSRPIDLSWYGGVNQYGYSIFTGFLGSALGVRPLGAVAAVVSALGLVYLLVRCGARRPLFGGILGAVVSVGNLVSGRTTFAVGAALGTLALCAFAMPANRWVRLVLGAVLAALATWASPVAGLFVGLAGAALLLARQRWDALVLCLAPAAALLPVAIHFSDGGAQPYTAEAMRVNVALAVAVLLLVPHRVIRFGAALTVALLVGAYYVSSPVGSNAIRLSMLYTVPVVAAYATLSWRWLVAALAALVWWQSPVMTSDLVRAGSVESKRSFYQPLIEELAHRGPIGRIEVVPLRDHWESAYVAPEVPLARGWLRQVDVDRNALFYEGDLDAGEYADWLRRNAVSYVALAPGKPFDRYGRQEASLVEGGLPYLREVWRDGTWRLYAVVSPEPIVSAPAQLVSSSAGELVFTTDQPGDVLVRVRWSRWLTVDGQGACLARGPDDWTTVRIDRPGRHTLSSSLTAPKRSCG
jgi:hypothetical protein